MTDFHLRSIEADDAAFLHTLMNHSLLMERLHQPATTLADWQEAIHLWHNDPDEKGYIVVAQEQPIGWFAVNGLCSSIPYIKMAALLPLWQNKGIGRQVVQQLCADLRDAGFSSVRLYTDCDNARAQRCYVQSGFRIISTLEEPWPDGSVLQRYEMEKEL